MSEEKKEKKALPFEVSDGFTAIPSAVFTLYMKHPDFDVYTLTVYTYLLMRHNDKYGFAFPTIDEIAYTLHISDTKVKRAIKTLKKLELIRVDRNDGFLNNVYYFVKPIEDEAQFFVRFKEVEEAERKHTEKWARINRRRKTDKARYLRSLEGKPKQKPAPLPTIDPDEIIKML